VWVLLIRNAANAGGTSGEASAPLGKKTGSVGIEDEEGSHLEKVP